MLGISFYECRLFRRQKENEKSLIDQAFFKKKYWPGYNFIVAVHLDCTYIVSVDKNNLGQYFNLSRILAMVIPVQVQFETGKPNN